MWERQTFTMLPHGSHDLVPAITLHFLVAIESAERLDQQVRDDLVEDDVPRFAGPRNLIDVEDAIVLFIIEVEKALNAFFCLA